MKAILLLEDGTCFKGTGFGAEAAAGVSCVDVDSSVAFDVVCLIKNLWTSWWKTYNNEHFIYNLKQQQRKHSKQTN